MGVLDGVSVRVDYPLLSARSERAGNRGGTATMLEKEAEKALSELEAARRFGSKWDILHVQLEAQVGQLRGIADAAAIVCASVSGVHLDDRFDVHLADLRKRLQEWVRGQSAPQDVPADVHSNDDALQTALTRAERDATRWEAVAADLERRLTEKERAHLNEKGKLELERADAERATATLREAVRVAAGLPDGSCNCYDELD